MLGPFGFGVLKFTKQPWVLVRVLSPVDGLEYHGVEFEVRALAEASIFAGFWTKDLTLNRAGGINACVYFF